MRGLICALAILQLAHTAGAQVRVVASDAGKVVLWVNRGPGTFEPRDYQLVIDEGGRDEHRLGASSATALDQLASTRLATVILVESTTRFLSHVSIAGDGGGEQAGFDALPAVTQAIRTLASAGPSDRTLVAVIPFAPNARQTEFSAAGDLPAEPIRPDDFASASTSSLDDGMAKAIELLAAQPRSARKLVVVLGDGESRLSDALKQTWLAKADIEVDAIELVSHDRAPLVHRSERNLAYANLRPYGTVVWGTQASDLPGLSEIVRTQIASTWQVEFRVPAEVQDGAEHDLSLFVSGARLGDPISVILPGGASRPSPVAAPRTSATSSSSWLILACSIVGGALIIVSLLLLYRRRRPPRVAAVSIQTPVYIQPQPTQVLPKKTKVMRPTGTAAWLVEMLNGVPRRTLVLDLEGATIIGRGADAHIRFRDEYMSAQHAEIECIASTFTIRNLATTMPAKLRRAGSKKAEVIDHLELEDNDSLELGTTRLVFKCVKP